MTGFVLGEIHSHHLFGIIDPSHDLRTVLWGVGTIFFGTSSAKFLHDRLGKDAATPPSSKGRATPVPTPGHSPNPAPRAPAPGGNVPPPSDPWADNFPEEPDNGTQAPPNDDLRKRVIELLHTDTKGFTRTEIEKKLGVKRKLL